MVARLMGELEDVKRRLRGTENGGRKRKRSRFVSETGEEGTERREKAAKVTSQSPTSMQKSEVMRNTIMTRSRAKLVAK